MSLNRLISHAIHNGHQPRMTWRGCLIRVAVVLLCLLLAWVGIKRIHPTRDTNAPTIHYLFQRKGN